jgi:hypothetical protein
MRLIQASDLNADGQMSDVMISEIISCSSNKARDENIREFKRNKLCSALDHT